MPAIAPHATATTDSPWNGPEAEAKLKNDGTAAYYKSEFAWYDGSGDDTKKSTYKFPHHVVSGDGAVGAASVAACNAIIAVLNGGRGGAKIPEADRAGVHAHAAKHLKDAGKTPAELKSEGEYLKALEESSRSQGPKIERRTIMGEFEVREGTADTPPLLIGHAAVFDTPADLGYFTEKVARGAFTRAITEDDVRALWNHDPNYILGRNKAGTLKLSEDNRGLAVEINPPDTQFARDLMTSMKRGDVSQMSFGFSVRSHQIDRDTEGNITRTLKDVKLYDVSPVTYPAYTQTDVAVRSIAELLEEFRRGPEEPADVRDESWKHDLELRERELELARIIS